MQIDLDVYESWEIKLASGIHCTFFLTNNAWFQGIPATRCSWVYAIPARQAPHGTAHLTPLPQQ